MKIRGMKYVPRKQIDNRMLQRRRSPKAARRFTIVLLLGCLLVLGMVFSGWIRWKQREIVYRTNQYKSRLQELEEKNKRLTMEFSRLRAPERAAKKAREELGMELPKGGRITQVEKEKLVNSDRNNQR